MMAVLGEMYVINHIYIFVGIELDLVCNGSFCGGIY